ncbi:plasmid transfer protein [Sphingobacterium suaedae]|uniref:Plasmid transfer protein n=1 Tax=Sphingobacterium suaedae TaxID=1686402 RepID=A0ABW5KNH1_9SPHI
MKQPYYPVYKGLQKPLVYKGFKGRFIFWGAGAVVSGLIFGGLIGAITNMYIGALMIVCIIPLGLFYTLTRQKAGLHNKTIHRGVFIHPINLTIRYESEKDNF